MRSCHLQPTRLPYPDETLVDCVFAFNTRTRHDHQMHKFSETLTGRYAALFSCTACGKLETIVPSTRKRKIPEPFTEADWAFALAVQAQRTKEADSNVHA